MIDLIDLVKKLSQQVLSRLTLQYLILTVDGTYLGKAILLWTVYSADDVKRYFQCRAWVRISEELGQREILLAILKQVTGGKEEEKLPLQSPQRSLHDFLVSKRYLIVLYGVRTAKFLDNIKAAFPYSLNGSRVITVVQNDNVAMQINSRIGRIDGWPQSSNYLEEEYGITGGKAAIDKLTQSILNPDIFPLLISIKGTVGSGRTTLLWPIYNAKAVKQHFQCRAWIDVPQEFSEESILTDIFKQVTSVKLKEELTVELLRKRLRDFLAQKRYLVVLCDVWTSKIWENLKPSLPNSFNGSRVIFALSGGEANKAQKTNSLISGTILVRKLPDLKDVQDFSDQKGAEHCDRLSDVKDEESSIVGLDDKVRELAELTLNSYKLHFLISVFGGAGSGKTTLVRTIYNSVASKQHFKCRAWVNIPLKDEFNEEQLLIDLLGQLGNAKQKERLDLEQLRERLHLFLTWKRYLIVLDDVPTPYAWEKLNRVFPNLSNGSRVIITTRDAYLAYHISPGTVVLQLRPLTDDESRKLFLKKVGIKDLQLISLKEKILQRCHGLPLQIVLLGDLLSRKNEYNEWQSVIDSIHKMEKKKKVSTEDQMNPSGKSASSDAKQKKEKKVTVMEYKTASEDKKDFPNQSASSATKQKEERKLLTGATSGEDQSNTLDQLTFSDKIPLSDIMDLAYQDLTPPLECCFLYLGLFPKSYEIPLRRLYQLWIAEGFAPTDTPLEKVKEYFEELHSRSMIEVTKLKLDGSPKACRVPTTIYDILFLKTENFGFSHIDQSSGTLGSPWFNIRRHSENLSVLLQSEHIEDRVQQLRSYISFYGKRDAPTYTVKELLSKVVGEGFGMLAVLDLEGVYKPVLSDTLGKLPYLRYLGLRRTLMDDIPQSVGDLSHLETLDIKHTFITKLPGTIWKAKKLQHLYMSDIDVDMSTLKTSDFGSLNNLKILWGLVIKKERPYSNSMDSLPGLRKLKLTCNDESNEDIATWISQMDKLQSLNLRLTDKLNQPLDLKLKEADMSKWKTTSLSQLYLLGKLPESIATIGLPANLEILTLSMTHLSEDPMHMLGELEKLKVLRLYAQSFTGQNMTCHGCGFRLLRVLKLWMLDNLECWTVQEGAMPMLRELEIRCCKNLKMPDGLEKLSALKELTLTNMKEDFVANVERNMGRNVAIMKKFYFSSSREKQDPDRNTSGNQQPRSEVMPYSDTSGNQQPRSEVRIS